MSKLPIRSLRAALASILALPLLSACSDSVSHPNTDAYLKGLTISPGILSPAFDVGTTSYGVVAPLGALHLVIDLGIVFGDVVGLVGALFEQRPRHGRVGEIVSQTLFRRRLRLAAVDDLRDDGADADGALTMRGDRAEFFRQP